MYKRAYLTNLTYEVSDAEKIQAEKALIFFNHTAKLLDDGKEHLDVMKTPFKDNPTMAPEEVMKARAAIRRFRDKSIEKFNDFKKIAFQCVNIMENFSSDTQTAKLVKSFISSIDDLEFTVNKFVDIFNDLEDKNFAEEIVKAIEAVQEQCDEIDEIIEDRIKQHIQTNILATTWVDMVGDELNKKIEKKTPLILDLFNSRQDSLNDAIKEKTTKQ